MSKQEPEKPRLRVQRVTRKLGGGISESASVVHFSLAFSIILASFQPNAIMRAKRIPCTSVPTVRFYF